MTGLQLRDAQSTSEDGHKTTLTDEGQTSPCIAVWIPSYEGCKSIFLKLLTAFSSSHSPNAQSLLMSRISF